MCENGAQEGDAERLYPSAAHGRSDPYGALLALAEQAIKRLHEKVAACAGAHYPRMLTDYDYARKMLASPDPKLRWAALEVLGTRWQSRADHATTCEGFLEDSDEDILALALSVVSDQNFGSFSRPLIARFLALVMDESRPLKVRRSAYCAFLNVLGEPYSGRPRFLKLFTEESIDEVKVSAYLTD
jgi:hypothetical protein